ncbi:hypothetical protein [uncultured Alistipes sp.]|jgi:hypothetical protein|uniref:hypothetical protein n=1 Tax=uncultured Alistipes sp. TaxID=538949 RepID=UPI0025F7A514|nr:hypothetical protein [uncultured Alistipes sp.]
MKEQTGNEVYSTLTEIRTLMNRSSRFLNVSAYAPIIVGLLALAAAWAVNHIFNGGWDIAPMLLGDTSERILLLMCIACGLVAVCIGTAVGLSYYEAHRNGTKIVIDAAARRLLWNFFLPLIVGGIFCIALFVNGYYGLTSSIMLIFYGMALISASNHTFSSVRYLGYAELALGLADSFYQGYALIFWAIGFGALNILYGIFFLQRKANK